MPKWLARRYRGDAEGIGRKQRGASHLLRKTSEGLPKDLLGNSLPFPQGLRQQYSVSAEPIPAFDGTSVSAIQMKSHSLPVSADCASLDTPGRLGRLGKYTLRHLGCRRKVKNIRENPTPTEGVVARYENKETTLWKSRDTGSPNSSSRYSEQAKDPPPQTQPHQGQRRQTQAREEGEASGQAQDQSGSEGKDGKEAGHSQAQSKSLALSDCE